MKKQKTKNINKKTRNSGNARRNILATMAAALLIVLIVLLVIEKSKKVQQKNASEQQGSSIEVPVLKSLPRPIPTEIKGKVVGMTSRSIIIDNSKGALELGININTPVSTSSGKLSIVDVKAGDNVIAQVDSNSREVKSIVIEK